MADDIVSVASGIVLRERHQKNIGGDVIRQARKELGLTLRQLGKKVGVAYQSISDIENKRRLAPHSFILKLAALVVAKRNETN